MLLLVGAGLYYRLGRNAWYFQFLHMGESPSQAASLARRAGQEMFPSGSLVNSLMVSAKIWKTWALVGIYFTTFGGFIALTAWLPTYWTAFHGVSAVAAGSLAGAFAITASLSRVFGGTLADRLSGENTTVLALFIIVVGAGMLGLSNEFAPAVVVELLLAFGMGIGNAAVFKMVPQAAPRAVGGVAGWVGGLGAFGGFAIPPLLGLIVRSQGSPGYAYGFFIFVALAAISFLLIFLLKQSAAAEHFEVKKKAAS